MARRHFTVDEVQKLIPSLEKIFSQALQLRSALRAQEKVLEKLGITVSLELLEEDESRAPFDVRRAKGLFRAYYEALGDQLARIAALGAEVKDLETGLVDFPGKRGDEEILLCWRLGEDRLGFWHTAEAGFAGRRPIDDQVPREPRPLD